MTDNIKSVNPRPFIRELDNIMAVEITPNGNEEPVVIYEQGGRRFLVQVSIWEVTDEPFYGKKGLQERLTARREAS